MIQNMADKPIQPRGTAARCPRCGQAQKGVRVPTEPGMVIYGCASCGAAFVFEPVAPGHRDLYAIALL